MISIWKGLALLIALAMFVFSLWMYSRTGDWVAIVFAMGSVGYAIYFFSTLSDRNG